VSCRTHAEPPNLGGCNVPGDHQLERADQVNRARLDRPIRPILAADQAVLENAGGGTSRSSGSMDGHKRCPPQRQRWYCSSVTEHERWPMHGGAVRLCALSRIVSAAADFAFPNAARLLSPMGEVGAGFQGVGMLGAQDALTEGEKVRVLVAGGGRSPACPVQSARWARVSRFSGAPGRRSARKGAAARRTGRGPRPLLPPSQSSGRG
jgi:hypothetical protein